MLYIYTVIQGVVYDLAATGLEYVGIGISQNNLMVCYIYTVIQGVVYDLASTGLEYVGIGI